METGVGLLIEFEAPIGAEPDDGVAAELKIKAVSGGSGMGKKDRDIAVVPRFYGLIRI